MKESIQLSILVIRDPIEPRDVLARRKWFKYNQFVDSHQWVRSTEKENMKVKFRVDSILYEDGTTRTFD